MSCAGRNKCPMIYNRNEHEHAKVKPIYSPNNRRTRFNTLSFSGSYGWSLDGISSTAGKASEYASTTFRMRSATCYINQYRVQRPHCMGRHTCWLIKRTAISFRSCVKSWNAFSIAEVSVFASTTRKFRCGSGPAVTCWIIRNMN
jgi:hypothetical protein